MDDKEPLTGFKKFAKTPYGFAVGILIASICTIILYYLNVEQKLCGMGFVLIAGLIYIIMKRFGCDNNKKLLIVALSVFVIVTATGMFAFSIPNVHANDDWESFDSKGVDIQEMEVVGKDLNIKIQYNGDIDVEKITAIASPMALACYNFYNYEKRDDVTMVADGNTYTVTIPNVSSDNVLVYHFSIYEKNAEDPKKAKEITKDGFYLNGSDSAITKSAFMGNAYFVSLSVLLFAILAFFMLRAAKNLEATRERMEAEGRLYPKGYGRCKQCGTVVLPGEIICRKCGTYIDVPDELRHKKDDYFQCSECGAEVPADSSVCPKCGASFDEDDETIIVEKKKEE